VNGAGWTDAEKHAVLGGGVLSTCATTVAAFGDGFFYPQNCPASVPAVDRYDALTNPLGIRCTVWDANGKATRECSEVEHDRVRGIERCDPPVPQATLEQNRGNGPPGEDRQSKGGHESKANCVESTIECRQHYERNKGYQGADRNRGDQHESSDSSLFVERRRVFPVDQRSWHTKFNQGKAGLLNRDSDREDPVVVDRKGSCKNHGDAQGEYLQAKHLADQKAHTLRGPALDRGAVEILVDFGFRSLKRIDLAQVWIDWSVHGLWFI